MGKLNHPSHPSARSAPGTLSRRGRVCVHLRLCTGVTMPVYVHTRASADYLWAGVQGAWPPRSCSGTCKPSGSMMIHTHGVGAASFFILLQARVISAVPCTWANWGGGRGQRVGLSRWPRPQEDGASAWGWECLPPSALVGCPGGEGWSEGKWGHLNLRSSSASRREVGDRDGAGTEDGGSQ